jgi:BRCT domain type II-containing protein
MTTTKEGGGRGEREREKREGEESRNTFLLESSKLMRKKRRERG